MCDNSYRQTLITGEKRMTYDLMPDR